MASNRTMLGERLKQERKRLGLTQSAAGNAVGVTDTMWGRYERGAVMGVDVESKLQGAGFDVDYIFTGFRTLQILKEALEACWMTLEITPKTKIPHGHTFEIEFDSQTYQAHAFKETFGEIDDPEPMSKPYVINIEIYVGDIRVNSLLKFAYCDFRDDVFTRIDVGTVQRLINATHIAEIIDSAQEDCNAKP